MRELRQGQRAKNQVIDFSSVCTMHPAFSIAKTYEEECMSPDCCIEIFYTDLELRHEHKLSFRKGLTVTFLLIPASPFSYRNMQVISSLSVILLPNSYIPSSLFPFSSFLPYTFIKNILVLGIT